MICLSMKIFVIILAILGLGGANDSAEVCMRPDVKRTWMHVYQIVHNIDVKVYHCLYPGVHQYSDITDNCIKAFRTGKFIDKWSNTNDVFGKYSDVGLTVYTTKADLIGNQIILKSGTVCRYDRGYCYDTKESSTYAVVWEVVENNPNINGGTFEQVFCGWLDIWQLRNNSLRYAVYQDSKQSKSFALQLVEKQIVRGRTVWQTDQFGLVVSEAPLRLQFRTAPILNETVLRLEDVQTVAESVASNCDIQGVKFPLDFEKQIDNNDINNPKSLKFILWILQKEIIKINTNSQNNGIGEKSVDTNIVKLQEDAADAKKLLDERRADIENIRYDLMDKQDSIARIGKNIYDLDAKLQNTLYKLNTRNIDFVKVEEKSDEALIRITNLEKSISIIEGSKKYDNLEKYVFEIQDKLTKEDEEIINNLSDKGKEISTVKSGLNDILTKLKNRDDELRAEKYDLLGRFVKFENDLGKKNKDLIKCCNETKTLLSKSGDQFLLSIEKVENKLSSKYTELLDKLNLVSEAVVECQNVSDIVLSNQLGITNITNKLAQAENGFSENRGKLIYLEHQLDINRRNIETITKNLTETQGKVFTEINNMSGELRFLKNQNSEFRNSINITNTLQNNDLENIKENLAKAKGELDISLQDIESIKENLTQISESTTTDLNKISEEFRIIKDKNSELEDNLDISISQNMDIVHIKKNLTETSNKLALSAQDLKNIKENLKQTNDEVFAKLDKISEELQALKSQEVALLQADVKDLTKTVNLNKVNVTDIVNNCQLYVNSRLKAKDVENTQIYQIFVEKDLEISKLKEKISSMTERENDLEDKITKFKEHTALLIYAKDDELKRLLEIITKVDKAVTAEKVLRDQEHEYFKKTLLEIKEEISIPPPY